MIRAVAALLLAAALVGCGQEPPTFDLAGAREVQLTLKVSESVSFRGKAPAKELRLLLAGPASEEPGAWAIRADVRWAELTYRDADGTETELGTDVYVEDPAHADPLTRARRGLLEGLVGARVVVHVPGGPGDGDVRVEGLARALRTARDGIGALELDPDVVDAAVGGLEPLVDDESVAERLRAAGLGAAPGTLRGPGQDVRRTFRVRADGHGVAPIPLIGSWGEGRGGSPTARVTGAADDATVWGGDPGPAPPEWLGAVRAASITVEAQTEYEPETLRPLRGSVTVELPFEGGPLVRRTTEFVLLVRE